MTVKQKLDSLWTKSMINFPESPEQPLALKRTKGLVKINDIKDEKKDFGPIDQRTKDLIKVLPVKDSRVDFKDFYTSKEAFYNSTTPLHGFKEDKKRLRLL